MALESSLWQRNKRNFILFIIVGAAMLISALALKAYRSRKRFNVNPLSTFPLTTPNSNSSIPSTEGERRSSSSPREQEQGEKAVAQGQKQQVPQIGEQAVKQQSKQELQGKEQEQLRLSASLGFLPVPQKPGAQNTQQNVWAAPAPVKPAPIPQAQHEKGSDWQVKLVLLALPFLYTLFFMSIHRGLLGIAIIAVGVPGYGCFVATELAIKLWSSQRKFAAFFTSFAIFYLCLILFFVFFVMLPNISYLIKGDPPGAPSSITPGIPNTFLTSTALCTGGSTDPSCSAKQVFDDYCLELSNGGETPPYLYLTSRSSKFMPGRTEIHGCMHKQVYCPTG